MLNTIWHDVFTSGLFDKALYPICGVLLVAVLRGFTYRKGDRYIRVGGKDSEKIND